MEDFKKLSAYPEAQKTVTSDNSMIEGLAEEKKITSYHTNQSGYTKIHGLLSRIEAGDIISLEKYDELLNTLESQFDPVYAASTPIPKEDKKDVPPGIIKFKGEPVTWHEYSNSWGADYNRWATIHLSVHPISDVEIILVNGVEWSVGEKVSNSNDKWVIKKLAWSIYPGRSYEWIAYYETDGHPGAIDPWDPVCVLSKLPQPKEHTRVDKERLGKFVLAAMAGNRSVGETPEEYSIRIIEISNVMMTAVDNYKPEHL